MEFFNKANVVKLRSHLGKYLIADEDEETVSQSRTGTSREARWTVEFVDGKSHAIRLKSCHGCYLTASDEPFLLGMTGKKVVQTFPAKRLGNWVEWEPIREGDLVKLRTKLGGRFLRANGAMPPWRNSITCDVPHRTATQDWILWEVEVVDDISLSDSKSSPSHLSSESSFSSLPEDFTDFSSRSPSISSYSPKYSRAAQDGMKYFEKAKAVRLQSHHGKYLVADEDEKTVRQSRNGSSHKAHWTVEFVKGKNNAIHLKSCHGLYLMATDEPFLLGMTGKKVIQALPATKMDNAIEWEPIKESGYLVKLQAKEGKFLRANGGMPPWRNSITHDVPHRTVTQDWVLWSVDVVDINLSTLVSVPSCLSSASSFDFSDDDFMGSPDTGSPMFASSRSGHIFKRQGNQGVSPAKSEGRMIYYHVADDNGKVDDGIEAASFNFKGNGLEELTEKLEEETGLENIIVCSRNRFDGKLYPLRLALPPNNATMNIVVVPSTTKAAREFVPGSP